MKNFEFSWSTVDKQHIHATYFTPENPDETKAVLCIIHGLGEHFGRYKHFANFLCDNQLAVFGFDWRGHGLSSGQRGHVPNYDIMLNDIDMIIHAAQEKFPGKNIFLLGHSMGGNFLANFLINRQPKVQGAIITSAWHKLAFKPPHFKRILGKIVNNVYGSFSQPNGLIATEISRDPETVKAYVNDELVHNRISVRLFTYCFQKGLWNIDNANKIKVPLLVIHGSDDRITSPEGSAAFFKNANEPKDLKIWNGSLHECLNEINKEEVYAHILQWMNNKM